MSEEVKSTATDLSSIDSKIKHLGELFDQLRLSLMDKMDLAFDCGRNNPQFYKHKVKRVTAAIAAKELIGKKNILVITGSGISAASGIPPFKKN